MTPAVLRDLTAETVTQPRLAAARLISLDLPRHVLWQGLVLAIVLNALAFWLGTMAAPAPQPMPPMLGSPFMFALTLGCGAVITVFAITLTGNWLGGEARLEDVLVLVVWLQCLRFLVQIAATVMSLILPGLALIMLMAINIYGFWIFLNFIDVAHRFNSIGKAFGVLLMAAVGIALGLVIMLSLIGASTVGVSAHV